MEEQLEDTKESERRRKLALDVEFDTSNAHKQEIEASIEEARANLHRLGRATKNTIHDTNHLGKAVAFDIDAAMAKLNDNI
jgi:hypothetical protein